MEFGIGQDRRARDLVEGDVLRGQIGRRRDHQRIADALRVADRPGKRLHAAEAAAHDRGEALDAEIIGEPCLRIDPILDGDDGKVRAPGLDRRRIDRRGTGRTEAAAQVVDADDEKPRRVDRLARSHHVVPPTFAVGLTGVCAGDMMRRVQRMADQNRVGPVRIELAIGLVHQLERGQDCARRERKRFRERGAPRLNDADRAWRLSHDGQ